VEGHIYKQVEITGTSDQSVEDAVRAAIKRAGSSVRNMRWFEVTDIRGHIAGQALNHWQVTVKIGFTLED
jgi:dodecin